MNFALITGASSGIGYELAILFASNRHNLILVARQENKLIQMADLLEEKYKINTLVIPVDLCQQDSADEIYRLAGEKSVFVNYLVNNAGFYVKGRFSETSWEEEQKLIQQQCLSHVRLIKLFLPGMIRHGSGGILNVASTGSYVPGPNNAVYCAAKSFVLSFSEALAEEMSGSGITVTALCPGGTATAFQDPVKRKKTFFLPLMDASVVARSGYKALMKGKRVVIPGFMNKLQVFLVRFIPRKLAAQLAGLMVKE